MLGVRQVDHNNEMTVSGPSFEELTLAEMNSIQGMGDIQDETTKVCVVVAAAKMSSVICGYTVGFGIGAAVTFCR